MAFRKDQRVFAQKMQTVYRPLARMTNLVNVQGNGDPPVLAALRTAAVEVTLATHPSSPTQIGRALLERRLVLDDEMAASGMRILAWDYLACLSEATSGTPLVTSDRFKSLTSANPWEAEAIVELEQVKGNFFANQGEPASLSMSDEYPQRVYRWVFEAVVGEELLKMNEWLIALIQGSAGLAIMRQQTRPYWDALASGRLHFDDRDWMSYMKTWNAFSNPQTNDA